MTCVDLDIHQNISFFITNNKIPGVNFDMIYYANDTVLFFQKHQRIKWIILFYRTYFQGIWIEI